MKSHFLRALLLSTVLLGLAIPGQAQQKTGYVDLKKLFEGYWKTKQADANLKDRAGEFDKKKKEMLEDYQKAQDEYKKLLDAANDQAVSAEEREKRKKTAETRLIELREIEQSLTAFDRTARADLAGRQKNERDKIIDEIRAIISSVAKKGGYSSIINIAAEDLNNTNVILFSDGKDDVTEEVLKQLNATAPLALPGSPSIEKKADPKKK